MSILSSLSTGLMEIRSSNDSNKICQFTTAPARIARCVRRAAGCSWWAAASPATDVARLLKRDWARRSSTRRTSCSTRRCFRKLRRDRSSRAIPSYRCGRCVPTRSYCSDVRPHSTSGQQSVERRDASRRRIPDPLRPSRPSRSARSPRTFPIPGLTSTASASRTLSDAIHSAQPRAGTSSRLRTPRRLDRLAARRRLTFVFVGAGYAGVEALAELSDLVD